jgi:hypothetical protein
MQLRYECGGGGGGGGDAFCCSAGGGGGAGEAGKADPCLDSGNFVPCVLTPETPDGEAAS